jgi:hypothetical protein
MDEKEAKERTVLDNWNILKHWLNYESPSSTDRVDVLEMMKKIEEG